MLSGRLKYPILLAALLTPVWVWAQALDTVDMGQGAGVIPKYTAVPNCTYGVGYLTGSHSWACAPTPTATASATPTPTATATPVVNITVGSGLSGGGAGPTPSISLNAATTNLTDVTTSTTWTPSDGSGGSLSFSAVSVHYAKLGPIVFVYGQVTYPSTADTHNSRINSDVLPAVPNQNYISLAGSCVTAKNVECSTFAYANSSPGAFGFQIINGGTQLKNSDLSTSTVWFSFFYPAS